MQVVPVIMAGGSGTRLWPLSRALYPKQFLSLISDRSMLQETIARLDGLKAGLGIFLCNAEHRFLVAEQLRASGHEGARIVLEPSPRNTAPAVALAALDIVSRQGCQLMGCRIRPLAFDGNIISLVGGGVVVREMACRTPGAVAGGILLAVLLAHVTTGTKFAI